MKKVILVLSFILTTVVACSSTPKATTPENTSGFNTQLNLPDGVRVRETPRGKVLELYDPKAKSDVGKQTGIYEVKFQFDKAVEIGEYKQAYNLVYTILNNNSEIRIMVEGNSSKEGKAPYNYNLSVRRSDTSYNYLIKLGTKNNRLLKNAFGEGLPEYPTLEANRRTEFIVIMNEADLKKYNDFAKTVDINKEN